MPVERNLLFVLWWSFTHKAHVWLSFLTLLGGDMLQVLTRRLVLWGVILHDSDELYIISFFPCTIFWYHCSVCW